MTTTNFYDPDQASFCEKPASVQNSIDLAQANWVTDFSDIGLKNTGNAKLLPDFRIGWLKQRFGSFKDKSVLELGSLEGAHTIQHSRNGCAEVIGVEANEAHFMKSLMVSNASKEPNMQFILGDFEGYLNQCDRRFDLISACGVLYHMDNPMQIIGSCAELSDSLFIWTVLYDEEVIPAAHQKLISGTVKTNAHGFEYEGHKHHYRSIDADKAKKDKNFSGGLESYALWLTEKELLRGLEHFGYTKIEKRNDRKNPSHCHNILLLAQK